MRRDDQPSGATDPDPASTGGGERSRADARRAGLVTARRELAASSEMVAACQIAADTVSHAGNCPVAVVLRVESFLHCYAVSGTWRLHHTVPFRVGAISRAFKTNRVIVDDPVDPADSPYPVTPVARVVLWVPVPGCAGQPIGVLKVELPDRTGMQRLRADARAVATWLGKRLCALGYRGQETAQERMVRHAYRISSAGTEETLVPALMRGAREVSGLSTAVGIARPPHRAPRLRVEPDHVTDLSERLRELTPEQLGEIQAETHRYGTWFTSGAPELALAPAPRFLLDMGVRTVIAVPVARVLVPRPDPRQRTLLVVDEQVRRVSPDTVGTLEIFAAQAYNSFERLVLLDSLRERAKHDPLTGLGHHATFTERMTSDTPGRTALLLIDVDKFKEVNDTLGHAAGDRLLVELSEVLREVLREHDELFRTGGDEFAAVLDVDSIEQAERIADRMVRAAHQAGCTISVGVSLHQVGEEAAEALKRADSAMYRAKREGRDRLCRAASR